MPRPSRSDPAKIEFYFSPRHEAYIREANIANYIRDIIGFYQELIGPYPFDDSPLKIVETSVYKPGGHSSLNVVTLAEYMLNRSKVPDPRTDPRFILRDLKILAHELAHQWWGSGVAVAESGAWSSEGLGRVHDLQVPGSTTSTCNHAQHPSRLARLGLATAERLLPQGPRALDRMRPALREKLLQSQTRGEAYSVLPLRLLAAEERVGQEAVCGRLAEVFRRYRGSTLGWQDFADAMGPDLERTQP